MVNNQVRGGDRRSAEYHKQGNYTARGFQSSLTLLVVNLLVKNIAVFNKIASNPLFIIYWRYTMRQIIILALLSTTVLLGACVDDVTTRDDSGGLAQQMNPVELVGMRGRSMDDEMNIRGFSNVGGYKNDGASMTTWWNAGARQCISVETRDGRVSKAETIVDGNCL